ncbi:hypothetical protein DICVIV_01946 [Dictyocaulus viviparus]|uniref:5' exonuclease Apollo n=1 Tax=Dictyocaulus viviparus TaxID=29172 RepID=A0A0D8Y6Q2_DICVI|nr:hypothetical protein DICVIV_01946 [Dictyocaulus viviparus]
MEHFKDLDEKWDVPVYCSETTAKILPVIMGKDAVSRRFLRPLRVGVTHSFEPNLYVTLLEANHCFGSVMILFEGAVIPGGAVLCTGSFRADTRLLSQFKSNSSFKKLKDTYISKLFLDNTYLDYTMSSFPERAESENILLKKMRKLRDCNILIPVSDFGSEEMLEKLSVNYSELISTSRKRLQIRKICGLKKGNFQMDNSNARIRTSQRHPCHVLTAFKEMEEPKMVIDLSLRNEYKKVIKQENLITIPYSDHSSRCEIIEFLSRLQFGELIPTGAPMNSSTAEELMKLSNKVVSDGPCETNSVYPSSQKIVFEPFSLQPANMSIFQVGDINLRRYAANRLDIKSANHSPMKTIEIKCYDKNGKRIL